MKEQGHLAREKALKRNFLLIKTSLGSKYTGKFYLNYL